MSPFSRYSRYALAFLAGVVLTAALMSLGFLLGRNSAVTQVPHDIIGAYSDEGSDAIVRAVKLVGPAVVNVDTSMPDTAAKNKLLPGLPSAPREGKGTGVIFDAAKGLMLTNAHVVTDPQTGEKASGIRVSTREGREFTGKVLGADRYSDIAVVKLSSTHLAEAKIAHFEDANQLAIGQWVIAIGNPYAQENTVTVGVISAVGRTIPVPERGGGGPFRLTGMIQTDAAINPGNSGGPLCNLKGEVIGINTAIMPWATGLGFSIPINQAMKVARQIVARQEVRHPYIGVMILSITPDLRRQHGLKSTFGAYIDGVQQNSPASRVGLRKGDVITQIDNKKITNSEDVLNLTARKNVGDTVKITFTRQGKTFSRTLKIGDRPDEIVPEKS